MPKSEEGVQKSRGTRLYSVYMVHGYLVQHPTAPSQHRCSGCVAAAGDQVHCRGIVTVHVHHGHSFGDRGSTVVHGQIGEVHAKLYRIYAFSVS